MNSLFCIIANTIGEQPRNFGTLAQRYLMSVFGQFFVFFPIRGFLHPLFRCLHFLNLPHYLRNRLNHSTARRDDSSNHLPPYIS